MKLFYTVDLPNEYDIPGSVSPKSEFYSYDCASKTSTLILSMRNNSYLSIAYRNVDDLIVTSSRQGQAGVKKVLAYNIYSQKNLFELQWF